MTEQPRDWDKELADIDRAIAKQPGAPPATPQTGKPISPSRRRFVALAWFWTALAIVLGVALLVWPYDRSCGLRLIFYLGAVFIALLMSFLGALASWSGRQGLAFLLSLIVMVFAGVMAMREILPRSGYAREALDWTCSSQPASPPTTPSTGQPGT
jgi:cytochrome bd-type quinol oxidase subunit 2